MLYVSIMINKIISVKFVTYKKTPCFCTWLNINIDLVCNRTFRFVVRFTATDDVDRVAEVDLPLLTYISDRLWPNI